MHSVPTEYPSAQQDAGPGQLARSNTEVSDRRQFDRIGKSCSLWLMAEATEEIKAQTVDICDSGVLCRIDENETPWRVGDFVRLRIDLQRETPNVHFPERVEADGRVIRFESPRGGDGQLMALAFHPRLDLGLR